MHCEIIAIGSELLLGAIVDTNTPHIAGRLHTIGLELLYTSAVGDHEACIADSIRLGMSRSEVVITTGGLGPTVDDMTREAVARATGRALIFDEALLGQIEQRFQRWGRAMTENNRRQAFRPEGSTVIENPVGTAPSFIVDTGASVIISLPGVPREMEYLLDNAVLPYLRRRFSLTGIIKSRTLHVSGLGESVIDQQVGDLEKLENPTVGLNAHSGVVDIRITARADSEAEADRLNAEVERAAREKLGDTVFGADADTLEGVTLARLAEHGEQVAVIEVGTLGRLSGRLAQADGGLGTFRGGQTKPALDPGADVQILARDAAGQFGATCGLACVVRAQNNTVEVSVGLWRAGKAKQWARGFGGHPGLAPEWAANMALDALRKALAG